MDVQVIQKSFQQQKLERIFLADIQFEHLIVEKTIMYETV